MPERIDILAQLLIKASKASGISIAQLEKAITKYSENYHTMVRNNSLLMTIFYIKNELGLTDLIAEWGYLLRTEFAQKNYRRR